MRRLSRIRPRRRDEDDGILPLVNIVFLLLIFFMVAGRLAASDPFGVEPARSAAEGEAPPGPPLILLGADGRLALDGAEMEEQALVEAVAARVAARRAAGGAAEARLKADGGAEAAALVALLGKLKAAGVETAVLLTARAGG